MSIRDDAEGLVRDGAWHSSAYHDFGSAWELAKAVAGLAREARKADDELLRRALELLADIEWTMFSDEHDVSCCPDCSLARLLTADHAPDCRFRRYWPPSASG